MAKVYKSIAFHSFLFVCFCGEFYIFVYLGMVSWPKFIPIFKGNGIMYIVCLFVFVGVYIE